MQSEISTIKVYLLTYIIMQYNYTHTQVDH